MAKRNFVICAVFIILVNQAYCQTSQWENFTDYKNVTSIAVDNVSSKIYGASNGGLFVVDEAARKVTQTYTNLNGLVINDLTALTIDNNHRLWVGASDGSIAILNLQNLTWKYIFDIKNSNESNKTINYLYNVGNFMFVATGYGIQKISTVNFNFVDAPYYKLNNFPNNTQVYALTANNNVLYAATKSGVAYANYVTSNLNNPASWTNYNDSLLSADVKTIEAYDNKIFAGSLSGFQYFDGTNWFSYPNASVFTQNTKFIKTIGSNLYFISGNLIYYSNSKDLSNVHLFLTSNNYTTLSADNKFNPVIGLSDNGVLITATGSNSFIYPNSPFTNVFNQITIDNDNNIWCAGGTANAGFYKYNGTSWENFNTTTHSEIGNSNWFQKIVSGNGNVWAMGYGGGPTLISGNVIRNFNVSNSNLPGIEGDSNFCSSFGGAYDNNGVFWTTFFATNSGKSLYAYFNNQWIGFVNPSIIIGLSTTLSDVAVDSYNTKWIVSIGRPGLYFFNENGTLTNPSDDINGIYNTSSDLPDVANVTGVIVDKNNEVWVSTNNGVFIISNPLGAIQNPNQKPQAQKLGIISGNLKVPFTENCLSITNDILNDKWIGTSLNGVFHLSADGSTLIEQFNTSKSPILDNKINTIAVSNNSGRAYFGTQKGLSSFQTNAIQPVQDFNKIIASPNPYLLPSEVELKIDGLVENSIIKIITLNGEVVSEFDSPGGRIAFWNGRNKNNQLAPTGIYIIVAFNPDGSKVGTGKVAVVNK